MYGDVMYVCMLFSGLRSPDVKSGMVSPSGPSGGSGARSTTRIPLVVSPLGKTNVITTNTATPTHVGVDVESMFGYGCCCSGMSE